MTKNEKTFLVIAGSLAVLGAGIGIALAMKKPAAASGIAPAVTGAVQGAIDAGLKTESAPGQTSTPDAEKVPPQIQQQQQPPPQIKIPNLAQLV